MDNREIGISHVQQKGFGFWKLYEGSKRVAQCDIEENPEGLPAVALELFIDELAGRSGKHEVNVYRKSKGESGGSRKSFFLDDMPTQKKTTMYGGNNTPDLMAIYDQARKDVEQAERMKRIEEKLDLLLMFIKEQNDDDSKNDNQALGLIGKMLAAGMKGSAAGSVTNAAAPMVRNAGAFAR